MIKAPLKIVALALALGLIVIQFFQIDNANPTIVEGETLEASVQVPADISQILGRSCNDCHSHKTVHPWYSNIQPGGWLLKDHVDEGRRELNFSVFNTYPPNKKARKLEEICEVLESKAMPLPSYLWLHGEATVSQSDAKALCDWANQAKAAIRIEP